MFINRTNKNNKQANVPPYHRNPTKFLWWKQGSAVLGLLGVQCSICFCTTSHVTQALSEPFPPPVFCFWWVFLATHWATMKLWSTAHSTKPAQQDGRDLSCTHTCAHRHTHAHRLPFLLLISTLEEERAFLWGWWSDNFLQSAFRRNTYVYS